MPAVSFTGLSSGLDTDSIIQALLAVDGASQTRLNTQQQAAEARQSALGDVESRMKTLRLAAQDLGSTLLWTQTQSVSSTDDKSVSATITGGAAPGGYTVAVSQLASAAQATYTYTAPTADSTWTINGVNVTIPAGSDIDAAVSTINGTEDIGVYAVNLGNGKMVLSSRTTGSATTINATAPELALQSTKAGKDLQWSLDGVAQPDSASNTVSNAIPGVQMTFKAPTTGDSINVSNPGTDADAVKTKLKAFVSAYNDVVSFTNGKLTEPKVIKNTSDNTSGDTSLSATEATQGVLFGDPGLRDMLDQMRTLVTQTIGTPPLNSFAALGISTGAASDTTSNDAKIGLLTFDEKTFDAAYDANPDGVKQLLGGKLGTDGLSQAWDTMIKPQTEAGGLLDQRVDMAGDDLQNIKDQIDRLTTRLSDKEAQYRKMFADMEVSLSKINSSNSSALSMLSSPSSSS
jgi:flagellar hook-associated protein 2